MADPGGATQAAFIAKYRGDGTLQGLMTGSVSPTYNIFDQGGGSVITPAFPYVYVHPITQQLGTAFAQGTDAADLYMQINVYTKYQGFEQARAIAAQIYALTHKIAFTITGFSNCLTLFDNRQELEEVTDSLIQHIADRYKVFTQG